MLISIVPALGQLVELIAGRHELLPRGETTMRRVVVVVVRLNAVGLLADVGKLGGAGLLVPRTIPAEGCTAVSRGRTGLIEAPMSEKRERGPIMAVVLYRFYSPSCPITAILPVLSYSFFSFFVSCSFKSILLLFFLLSLITEPLLQRKVRFRFR